MRGLMGRAVVDGRNACLISEQVGVSHQAHTDSFGRISSDLLNGTVERSHDRVIGASLKGFTGRLQGEAKGESGLRRKVVAKRLQCRANLLLGLTWRPPPRSYD